MYQIDFAMLKGVTLVEKPYQCSMSTPNLAFANNKDSTKK